MGGNSDAPVKRVTRSSLLPKTKPPVVAQPELPKRKKAKTAPKKEEKVAAVEGEENGKAEEEKADDGGASEKGRTIVIEYCKQCNSFKTRAFKVRDDLEKGVSGVTVKLNPDKPRKGCFEVRKEGGETFISLLDMKRPFKPMKDLNMDKVISDIIDKIK